MPQPPDSVIAGRDVRLYCVECHSELCRADDSLVCRACGARYPIVDGTPRLLRRAFRKMQSADAETAAKQRTGASFAYEWETFGAPRPEWRKNFLDYMQPHAPGFFNGKLMLDVGTGSGRHAAQAASFGADVVAVDVGASIDVARRNVPKGVATVQADAEALPFAPETFDIVVSIGVLHHLPDTERALKSLVRYARRGGRVHVYLYWQPPIGLHRHILRAVSAVRMLTTKLPHRLLRVTCYPLAALLYIFVVLPYRVARGHPWLRRLASLFPLKAYADYPFGVLVNDQFDRFSAPIERRFTQDQVVTMMKDAGLRNVVVLPHHGWVADGIREPADTVRTHGPVASGH
jgi:ubiquinone/menaquinone biosynthesis C-methylase UbiE/uncharacterized protein YbaR (Trm112 family)